MSNINDTRFEAIEIFNKEFRSLNETLRENIPKLNKEEREILKKKMLDVNISSEINELLNEIQKMEH